MEMKLLNFYLAEMENENVFKYIQIFHDKVSSSSFLILYFASTWSINTNTFSSLLFYI